VVVNGRSEATGVVKGDDFVGFGRVDPIRSGMRLDGMTSLVGCEAGKRVEI
jgi:hypothetical protein